MSETDATADADGVTVELRFFANFRQAVGSKIVERSYPENSVTIGDILTDLEEEYADLEFFDAAGEIREYLSILKDGTDIVHLDGAETPVQTGDRISLFPPVAGG